MKFKHKPKLGDIIYSLPFIKYKGGGTLYLDPDSEFFPGEREQWIEKFNWLMPLIKSQSYIEDVKIYDGESYDVDLDKYMDTTHLKYGDKVTNVDNHFIGQGEKPLPYKPWLTYRTIEASKIIVANSGNNNGNVDYKKLLDNKDFIFIGLEREAEKFEKRTGLKTFYYRSVKGDPFAVEKGNFEPVGNIAVLTAYINGANLFIGNQSLPLAIAQGLGKKCWVEQSTPWPNCIMGDYKNICDT